MKKNANILAWCYFIIFITASLPLLSQPGDNVNGRLWRLAKVYGFTKYFHPTNCETDWSNLCIRAIDSTLRSTSNEEANQILFHFINYAGIVPHATEPLVINADTNLNAEFSWMDDPYFDQSVYSSLDSILVNFRPHDNCLYKRNDYSDPAYSGYISFSGDSPTIPGFSLTRESHRLFVLFYYWNIINYFFADRYLMDQKWDTTLLKFIPIIRACATDLDFHKAFLQLATQINDSHGYTISNLLEEYFGTNFPKIKIEYIQQKTVVTKVDPAISEIEVGDVVLKINGIPIQYLSDSLRRYIPASNESAFQRDLHILMLRGKFNSNLKMELEGADGHLYTSSIKRIYNNENYNQWADEDPKPVWEITTCGYGYVNLGKLHYDQVQTMYNDLENTPAIIFDVRHYPMDAIMRLAGYLYSEPTTWAYFTLPDFTYPGWYHWVDNKFDIDTFSNPIPYEGKVYILVNAESQSHAEYTIMGLQQHPNAFTIGSQTAGADGNVSYITLPGPIKTYWTSLGVFYPDSATAQRVGVRIDSVVTPTIKGIRHGRDEVLEAALDCLSSSSAELNHPQEFGHFPNPANGLIYLSGDINPGAEVSVEVFNLLGQPVARQVEFAVNNGQIAIDAADWNNGLYVISLRDKNGHARTGKVLVQH